MYDNQRDPIVSTLLSDFFMALASTFLVVLVLFLFYLNPVAENTSEINLPGNVYVEIVWPPESEADVDLWVQAAESAPVSFRKKSGPLFNLLRDDLGLLNDFSGYNSEIAISRGSVEGKYTINVHLYNNRAKEKEIPVKYKVVLKHKDNTQTYISSGEQVLTNLGQEITLVSFELDTEGEMVTNSVDKKTFKSLRKFKADKVHIPAVETEETL